MNWTVIILSLMMIGGWCFGSEIGHHMKGSNYGIEGAIAYDTYRHGPDGLLFLDPFFQAKLETLNGKTILDAGCGSAPWAIYAARHGATVYGVDIQKEMIERGVKAVAAADLKGKVHLTIGDVSSLPFRDYAFDYAMSINVGSNLPLGETTAEGLRAHIREMARVLKENGEAVVTAPASFGYLFTNGMEEKKALAHVEEVLAAMEPDPQPETITARLKELTEVNRATFAIKEGKLRIIRDEAELVEGEDIWRKLPGVVLPNRYHSEKSYLEQFEKNNLQVVAIYRPKFSSKKEWRLHNESVSEGQKMGRNYCRSHPFVIFHLRKMGRHS